MNFEGLHLFFYGYLPKGLIVNVSELRPANEYMRCVQSLGLILPKANDPRPGRYTDHVPT